MAHGMAQRRNVHVHGPGRTDPMGTQLVGVPLVTGRGGSIQQHCRSLYGFILAGLLVFCGDWSPIPGFTFLRLDNSCNAISYLTCARVFFSVKHHL